MTTGMTVAVGYCETGVGETELRYADDLAIRLGATLLVVQPYRSNELALASSTLGLTAYAFLIEATRRLSARLSALGLKSEEWQAACRPVGAPFNGGLRPEIVVGSLGKVLPAEAIIHPADERSVSCGEPPLKILVPHGDGPSAVQAMDFAVRLATGLRALIGFYHTTWRKHGVVSENPLDHVCPGAFEVNEVLRRKAIALDLSTKTVIETADEVAPGIVRAAYVGGYDLIVMNRSPHILRGSHLDQVIKCSGIPVLEVPSSEVSP